MKKRIIRLLIIFTIMALLVQANGGLSKILGTTTAKAVGDLTVDWGAGLSEGDPIFVVNDMAPGDSESHTVTVHNDAAITRPVAVRGILTSETANLSSALNITISDDVTDLYGGSSPIGAKTLQQFFTDSLGSEGVFLSNQTPGSTKNYTFKVDFIPESGNEFQNASVVFDLKIGISIPTPAECAGMNLNGDLIFGTVKKDILQGTSGGDLIFALEGNDIVQGRGGDDCIV